MDVTHFPSLTRAYGTRPPATRRGPSTKAPKLRSSPKTNERRHHVVGGEPRGQGETQGAFDGGRGGGCRSAASGPGPSSARRKATSSVCSIDVKPTGAISEIPTKPRVIVPSGAGIMRFDPPALKNAT